MRVVSDPIECRRLADAAWKAHGEAVETGRGLTEMYDPKPGDLVLEISTSFRWLGREDVAPGEALGWLLRTEDDVWVVRPIFWDEGEFEWANCKFIVVERGVEEEALDRDEQPVSREREAFDALLSLVVSGAPTYRGGTRCYGNVFSEEHRIWVAWNGWRAGGQTADGARGALKDVIRAALIEQTGGTDAAS